MDVWDLGFATRFFSVPRGFVGDFSPGLYSIGCVDLRFVKGCLW